MPVMRRCGLVDTWHEGPLEWEREHEKIGEETTERKARVTIFRRDKLSIHITHYKHSRRNP